VPLPGPLRRLPELHLRAQPQTASHVPDHRRRHVLHLGEITQPLVRLQQHRVRRELAEALPDRYSADLASSLGYLGIRYAESGRPAQALPFAEEAAVI